MNPLNAVNYLKSIPLALSLGIALDVVDEVWLEL